MAEYSKENLYFLQLKEDFFKSHKIQVIEKMPNGKESVLFLLKLMCESTSYNGYLRFDESIPYDNEMLAAITNTDVSIVEKSLEVFKKFGLLEVTEDKSIFLPEVPKMTLSRTKGAMLKERQRVDNKRTIGGQEGDICPPYIRDKRLDNINNKNFVLDKSNTRSIIKEKKVINEKNNDKKSSNLAPTDTEVIEYAIMLRDMGETIDLKFFHDNESLYKAYLNKIKTDND